MAPGEYVAVAGTQPPSGQGSVGANSMGIRLLTGALYLLVLTDETFHSLRGFELSLEE